MEAIQTYRSVRSYINRNLKSGNLSWTCEHRSESPDALVNVLCSNTAPFVVKGEFICEPVLTYKESIHELKLFADSSKVSTVATPNVDELLAAATPSPFGMGHKTLIDTTVRNSFEIPAALLSSSTLTSIAGCFDFKGLIHGLCLTLEPYKLVLYTLGGHFDEHRDTVRGKGHIGTLVCLLNSDFSGGELEIRCGDMRESITKKCTWVALFGDCPHNVHPVLSGTRVSMLFDIYAEEPDGFEQERGTLPPPIRGTGVADDKIIAATRLELRTVSAVLVCLQHMYSEDQLIPSLLKGSDRSLYATLVKCGDFELDLIPVTLQHSTSHHEDETLIAKEFTLGNSGNSYKRRKTDKVKKAVKTKFIIPGNVYSDQLLDYIPGIEYTGNEAQSENSMYIVAALRISIRA